MKVVCINNIFRGEEIPFTIGKVYETNGGRAAQYSVISERFYLDLKKPNEDQYTVISDDGMIYELSISRFIDLEEWREKQIDKILL